MTTTVVNLRNSSFDIYIGRSKAGQPQNIWGNPFVIGRDGTREEVIEKYRKLMRTKIQRGEITLQQLKQLQGKRLGCFCKPYACHGDVLVEMIETYIHE